MLTVSSAIELDPELAFRLYVAIYDYEDSRTRGDLTFKKGDYLEIINKCQQGWWIARRLDTKAEGYIPSNYVALLKSVEAESYEITLIHIN